MTTRRLSLYLAGLVAAAALVLALVACGDDDETTDDPTATTAVETAAPSPETPGGAGTPGDETPTGSGNIPEVDDIVDAVLTNDPARVRPRVRFDIIACEIAPGIGGPPPCRQGEPEGTQVNVVEIGTCEAEHRRPDELEGLVGMFHAESLYGVYAGPASQGPDGDYVAVFTRTATGELDQAMAVTIDGGIMAYFKFTCGGTAEELVDQLGLGEPLTFTPPS